MFRMLHVLHTHRPAKQNIGGGIGERRRDDTRTIDEVDTLHQRNVLPNLSLTRNGRDRAHLLFTEGVDDGGLSGVGITDEADGNLTAVGVDRGELAKETDKSSLTEGIVDVGVESKTRVLLTNVADPGSLFLVCQRQFINKYESERDDKTRKNGEKMYEP